MAQTPASQPQAVLPRGRVREISTLNHVGTRLAGAGLLIDGEPGVGKTLLLDVARTTAEAAGVRTVMITAAPRRAHRPMQLVNELLAALAVHPCPEGGSLDELVLSTLRAAGEQRPTLLIVDDAHHVEARIWEALIGAARMLHAAPVALLMATLAGDLRVRDAGLPVLTICPLDDRESSELLADLGVTAPAFLRDRILEAAAGNPLALHELARASSDEWQRRCVRPPAALPLTPRLIHAFAGPVTRLPEVTQELLLAASANDSESLAEAAAAVARTLQVPIEETLSACLAAVEHRLIESDVAAVRFRSEIARSAVYEAAPAPRRRALHRAFAELLTDPDRRAWHRAAASLAPDEELARALETASATVRRRGRLRDALATIDRSARVSQDDRARARRLLDAAEMGFEIGRPDFARGFADQAAGLTDAPDQQREATWLRELYDLWRPEGPEALRAQLLRAEAAFADGDPERTRTALTRAIEKVEVCPTAALPLDAVEQTATRLGGLRRTPALAGVLAIASPVECGGAVLDTIASFAPDAGGDPRLARLFGEAAALLGDDAMALRSLSASVDQMRAQGRYGLLPFALTDRARTYVRTAGLHCAWQDAAEAAKLASETGQAIPLGRARAAQALIEGLAGRLDVAEARADEAQRLALGRPALLVDVHIARGLTELVRGDYEAAYGWLLRLWDPTAPMIAVNRRWAHIGDLAEAAIACGEAETVRPLLDDLAVTAAAVPSPVLRMAVAQARAALAGNDPDSEPLFELALAAAADHGPLSTGRVQLAYGTWLRRRRRVSQARLALRAAVAAFDQIGAAPWSERAAAELRAAGVSTGSSPQAPAELTAQELQIAQLAASGLSNREIGQRMFLSHRTVSTHLYRVFPKLGITARAQLRDALESQSIAA